MAFRGVFVCFDLLPLGNVIPERDRFSSWIDTSTEQGQPLHIMSLRLISRSDNSLRLEKRGEGKHRCGTRVRDRIMIQRKRLLVHCRGIGNGNLICCTYY